MTGTRPDELLATCWTTAGDAASDRADLRSPLPLRERIEAAAAAGFSGFGLLSDDLPAAIDRYSLSGIRDLLADNGIVHLELEGIPHWWADDERAEASDRVRHLLLDAAAALGAHHLKVTPDGDNQPWDPGTGPHDSPSSPARPTTSAPDSGSSSSPGPTSPPCTRACSSSRTRATRRAGSSSTPGTSPAPTPPSPSWLPSRGTASSEWN